MSSIYPRLINDIDNLPEESSSQLASGKVLVGLVRGENKNPLARGVYGVDGIHNVISVLKR
jgi:hypothetical protein